MKLKIQKPRDGQEEESHIVVSSSPGLFKFNVDGATRAYLSISFRSPHFPLASKMKCFGILEFQRNILE